MAITSIFNSTPASITNTPESKGFFSTFSSSLKTVYDFGVKSFNIIKNTSSILSSKVAETFNFVSNKVFSYLNNNAEETFNLLDQLETLSDNFFSTFSSSLKTVYDFGVKSFNIIKNTSSILSSKVAETFNFVSNKVFSYLNNNAEETFNLLDQLETLSDNELVEEILNTPENELDEVFEKMTYKKLAKLINNISDEQAQKLVNYIMPWHLEKVIDLITRDKLDKLFNENPNNLSLEELTEQELKKLSNENISDEWLENIIILAGEEKLAENFDIIPNKNLVRIVSSIPNNKLAKIINDASDESLVRIIDIIDSDNHDLSKSLVGQIITLIHDKKCAKQESGEVSDSDSGFSDCEDEIEVSDNQVEHSNSDFTMKLSGELSYNYFEYLIMKDDVVYV
ncbi:hypothetical protein [Rickettsia tamurae]|uniref:hypothetical protein n=1 Tax=Rickettsia tamurae TaxID=334545 RepID=UPI00050A232D|nr:hypothetical protein [Rickettsia tamurae]